MAQALKMRGAERSREAPDEAMGDEAVAAVKSSMAKRLTVEQQTHLDGRKKHSDKKARKLAEDAAPHSEARKKRLELEESLAAARTAIADGVQRKTLRGAHARRRRCSRRLPYRHARGEAQLARGPGIRSGHQGPG